MDQFEYIKILKEVMLPYAEEEMPLKWVFQQKTTTPNTQHLGSRPTRLTFCSGQPNLQTLIQ